MKYYIQRELHEYGPYTLADLQRYVALGNILLTDLTRSEGMPDWMPVSQVLGSISIPAPAPGAQPPQTPAYGTAQAYGAAPSYGTAPAYGSAGTVYGGAPAYGSAGTVYGTPGSAAASVQYAALSPPDLHWALVLVISIFTCGIFPVVWLFVEAAFVRKINRSSNFLGFMVWGLAAPVLAVFFLIAAAVAAEASGPADRAALGLVVLASCAVMITGVVLHWVGIFKMRSAIEEYYNTVEPIHLRLSGVMTFFFSVFYFQYHFSRIARWKAVGYIEPQ